MFISKGSTSNNGGVPFLLKTSRSNFVDILVQVALCIYNGNSGINNNPLKLGLMQYDFSNYNWF